MDVSDFFSTEWRAMAARISGSLSRRGVLPADREDILQETALRLYRSWEQVEPGRPIEPYARVIAYNIWRDNLRRGPREEPVDAVPELAGRADTVEQTCVARDELSRVRRAMQCLRPEQRQVLRLVAEEELGTVAPLAVASDALRMARMRARRQLRAAVQVASALVAATLAGLRRIRPRAASIATASVALALGLLLGGTPAPAGAGMTPLGPVDRAVASRIAPVAAVRPLGASARHGSAVAPARAIRHRSSSAPPPDYYWVQAGPADVRVRSTVDVLGYKVEVAGHDGATPVCADDKGKLGAPAAPLRCAR